MRLITVFGSAKENLQNAMRKAHDQGNDLDTRNVAWKKYCFFPKHVRRLAHLAAVDVAFQKHCRKILELPSNYSIFSFAMASNSTWFCLRSRAEVRWGTACTFLVSGCWHVVRQRCQFTSSLLVPTRCILILVVARCFGRPRGRYGNEAFTKFLAFTK